MKGSAKTFSEAPSQRSLVIQSTSAVVDLISGELLELTTFYPNGARETHRTQDDASVQLELNGFTGKEADEEVGVVYFGERYLIPRIGRWASPDPLAIHAAGGGEALNAYHYVGGNLLQARDPVGLESEDRPTESGGGTSAPVEVNTAPEGIRYGQEFVMIPGEIPDDARRVSKHAYHAPQSTLESLKERGASAYIYNPDAPLSLEEARYVEALPPSLARDFMQALAIFRGELTRSVESLPGVRGVRGGGNPEGSDSDAVYVVALAAQAASAVGPPAIARAAKAAMKAAKAAIAVAKEKVALARAGRAARKQQFSVIDDPQSESLGVLGRPRAGAALKTDPHHAFPDIIDNFSRDATHFRIPTRGQRGGIDRHSDLFQVEGSLNGRDGVFEWIIDGGAVTHRRFIRNGTVTGYPNQRPRR